MKRYRGSLGAFRYDPSQFGLSVDEDGKQYLKYTGTETDGKKISVPEGVVDATGMFQDCRFLETPPEIPDSVKVADCMFAGCDSLKEAPVLPEGLVSADWMLACSPSLEHPPVLPEGLVSAVGMFNGCTDLKGAPELPESLGHAEYMMWDCPLAEKAAGLEELEHPEIYGPEEGRSGFEDGLDDLEGMVPEEDVGKDLGQEKQGLAALFAKAGKEAGQELHGTWDEALDREALLAQAGIFVPEEQGEGPVPLGLDFE